MEPYVINYASFTYTKLVDASNQFHESVHIKTARDLAKDSGLDLVCFATPTKETLALCKIIDFGKWKYQQDKAKKKEMHERKVETKEVQFTPVIGEHDIEHKVKQVIRFLEEGDEVVINMKFKGIHHRLMAEGERVIIAILTQIGSAGKIVTRKQQEDNIYIRMTKA